MGKHNKQQSKGAAHSARAAPYGKKPKVEVTFEGPSSAAAPVTQSKNKASASASTVKQEQIPKKTAPAPTPAQSTLNKGKAKAEPSTTLSSTFIIIAGSYEKLLYGLEGSFPSHSNEEDERPKPTLKPIFIFPAHLACVKAIAASPGGKWLATGSEDEFVKVWDLRRRKEVGSLSQHTGSITSVHFPTASHLITTSADSTLSLFRTSDWALLKSLKGHSGRVNHVDVHPTGRVALSVGKDATLKMWDLMRGRGAASLPLGTEPEMVKFSPLGTHFAVLFPKKIQIYSLTLKLLHTLETKSRFNSLLFTLLPPSEEYGEEETEALCIGTEKGVVEIYAIGVGKDEENVSEDEEEQDGKAADGKNQEGKSSLAKFERIATLVGHTNRVRDISALSTPITTGQGEGSTVLLTTVSSDGLINLYDLGEVDPTAEEGGDEIDPCASYDTKGSRLTCVFLADGQGARSGEIAKPKSEEVEDDEDEEDSEEVDIYEAEEAEDDEGEMAVEFEDEEEEEEEEVEEEED